jgi:hypothetical protein
MVPIVIFLRPKQKEETIKNGQNQRVETLHKILAEFGFNVQMVEVGRFPTLKVYRRVANLLATPNSVMAITSFILLPWCLTPIGNRKLKIIDMMDSLTKTRQFSKQNIARWLVGRIEYLLSIFFKKEHIRIYISEHDRSSDKKITPKGISTFVIPNAVSVIRTVEASALKRLVFVGDLNYAENRKMLSELCTVLETQEMELNIYGAGDSSNISRSGNHIFHGTREDLELYQPGDLHLAPVRNTHGLSSKVFQAITRGIPVLSTENGTNGINRCLGLYVENDLRIWPVVIKDLIEMSKVSPLEVHWNGFECNEREGLRSALTNLLTKRIV